MEKLAIGSRIDDFEILQVVGQGAFGIVYRARQMSLNRQVALKITSNQGSEGRTMAQLEHESIVQVFSESLSHDGRRRLLCMQYVPGTTLEAVILRMHRVVSSDHQPVRAWAGQSILDLLDELNPEPPEFHPAGMRERRELGEANSLEAICWIGTRLAEALAYAHGKGVLHRDIKPANILQTRYGRPMLADFNLAFQPVDVRAAGQSLFGGTLAYMSPEHLDAFHPDTPARSDVVDQRSDIFSLGVVLYELASGSVGLPPVDSDATNLQRLQMILAARRLPPLPLATSPTTSGRVFDRAIRRCLEPDPSRRHASAADLAASLAGCQALSEVEGELPPAGALTRSALRHPFFWLALLAILPHLPIGSTVNIAYNSLRIVGQLSEPQKVVFARLIVAYNGILYPTCFLLLAYVLRPVYRTWKELQRVDANPNTAVVDAARRATTRWPKWVVGLACLGWLPGAVFFPVALHLISGPVPAWVFVHFMISCSLSGLIAMTYTYFAIQYLATRVFYPNLWCEVRNLRETAEDELRGVTKQLPYFQTLAGLVPLAGAILVVSLGPGEASTVGVFQFLVTTLIVLGFCGFQLANHSSLLIYRTIDALTRIRITTRMRAKAES